MHITIVPQFRTSSSLGSIRVLAIRRAIKGLPSYAASNAFGVSKVISHTSTVEQGIVVKPDQVGVSIRVTFEIDPVRAKRVMPFLCYAIYGNLQEGIVHQATSTHTPTLSEPFHTVVTGEYVVVRGTHLMVFDSRDGSGVATIPIPSGR